MTKKPEELTAEWKAGKLEDGWYYILLENGKTPISELETWYRVNTEESKEYYETEQAFSGYSDNIISEVLAPIPSYDEYKAMQAELAEHRHCCCCFENEVMQLKLAEMEELLRECREFFEEENPKDFTIMSERMDELLTRINAALNETQANPVDCNKIQESEE